jgi:glucosamine--fructose-6-phosphate aminotransferase (isomerizing)
MITTLKEIKARGSPIMAIASENDDVIPETADWVIRLPVVNPLFSPVTNSVALQLIAYYTAKYRGCPANFPA